MKFYKDLSLAFVIAGVQLKAKKSQTIIAVASVTFGISVFIFVVGYISGVNHYIREITLVEYPDLRLYVEPQLAKVNIIDRVLPTSLNFLSHAKIKNQPLNIRQGKIIVKDLRDDTRVKAVSSTVKIQVFYTLGASNVTGNITGIDFVNEDKLFGLKAKLTSGSFDKFSTTPNSIVMGEALSSRLNLELGDNVLISTGNGGKLTGILVGTVKTGILEIDKELCYANETMVKRLLVVPPSFVTEIKLKLKDKVVSQSMLQELLQKYDCSGSTWETDNAALFEGAALQDFILNAIAFIVMAIAGFGIFNILNIIIYEKMKDISILKALGFSDSDVKRIFMAQAIFIGLFGGLTGALIGFLLSYATSTVPYNSEAFPSVRSLPINFSAFYYFLGLVFALLVTSLAGYIPSRKAAKMDPITVLRG